MGDLLDNTPLLQNLYVSAIPWAAYPGQDGGAAVFDVLTGLIPPAGRISVTRYSARYMDQICYDLYAFAASWKPTRENILVLSGCSVALLIWLAL